MLNLENQKPIDEIDWKILQALQENARLSFSALGKRVGLSQPAIAERVRRLEDIGIIKGYQVSLDLVKLGYSLIAFIRMSAHTSQYPKVLALAQKFPEVLECHHIAGTESFIIKVAVSSMNRLEYISSEFCRYGQTITAVAFSSPIVKNGLEIAKLLEEK